MMRVLYNMFDKINGDPQDAERRKAALPGEQ